MSSSSRPARPPASPRATAEPIRSAPWKRRCGRRRPFTVHRSPIRAVAGAAGLILTADGDGTIRSWDAVTGAPAGFVVRADATFPEVAGGLVISADRGRVRRFGPDGREGGGVLYGQEFLGPIHRWDVAGGEPLSPLPTGAEGMSEGGLAADEDGRVLISVGQSGAVWRWDLTVPEPRAQLLGADQDAAPAVVPSGSGPLALFRSGVTVAGVRLPDKQLIVATGGDEGIERYDVLEDRRRESSPTGATVWTVTSGVWPDGRPFFAAGTADGRVHLVPARAGGEDASGVAGPGTGCARGGRHRPERRLPAARHGWPRSADHPLECRHR